MRRRRRRSPTRWSRACGCSDEELFLWRERGGALDLRVDPPELEPRAVREALQVLVNLRRARRHLSLSELVRAVLRETGLIELALSERHGEQAATNLLKLAEQAHAFAASGGGLRAFAAWLAEQRKGNCHQTLDRPRQPHPDRLKGGPLGDAVFVQIKRAVDFDLQRMTARGDPAVKHGAVTTGIGRVTRHRKALTQESSLGMGGEGRGSRGAIAIAQHNVRHRQG